MKETINTTAEEKSVSTKKEKKKKKAEVVVETENTTVDTEVEVKEEVVKEVIPAELDTFHSQNGEKVDVAVLLGKTEMGLKTEFYIYQIKQLMKHVGATLNEKNLTNKQLENNLEQLARYGIDEYLVSPIYLDACRNIEERFPSKVHYGVLIDAPLGEQPHKARLEAVKCCNSDGVDYINVVFPKSAISLSKLSEYKSKTNKLSKASKKPFGVMFDANLMKKDFLDVLKIVDNSKCHHVILNLEEVPKAEIKALITLAVSIKKNKKIYAYANVSNVSELSELLELKVEKVYTPYAVQIGDQLAEKFGIRKN